jgi:serine kinase of HPr protein (carbohydrate metabolism regulator)
LEQTLKIKTIHATAVSIEDKGILIVGKSGSGNLL